MHILAYFLSRGQEVRQPGRQKNTPCRLANLHGVSRKTVSGRAIGGSVWSEDVFYDSNKYATQPPSH